MWSMSDSLLRVDDMVDQCKIFVQAALKTWLTIEACLVAGTARSRCQSLCGRLLASSWLVRANLWHHGSAGSAWFAGSLPLSRRDAAKTCSASEYNCKSMKINPCTQESCSDAHDADTILA